MDRLIAKLLVFSKLLHLLQGPRRKERANDKRQTQERKRKMKEKERGEERVMKGRELWRETSSDRSKRPLTLLFAFPRRGPTKISRIYTR